MRLACEPHPCRSAPPSVLAKLTLMQRHASASDWSGHRREASKSSAQELSNGRDCVRVRAQRLGQLLAWLIDDHGGEV